MKEHIIVLAMMIVGAVLGLLAGVAANQRPPDPLVFAGGVMAGFAFGGLAAASLRVALHLDRAKGETVKIFIGSLGLWLLMAVVFLLVFFIVCPSSP